LEAVGDFSETITFNGTFDFPSIYRGYPDESVDAAWKRITKGKLCGHIMIGANARTPEPNFVKPVGPFSIAKSDVEKLGKSPVECSHVAHSKGTNIVE